MRLTGRGRLLWGIIGIAVLTGGVVWAVHAASARSAPAASSLAAATASSPGGSPGSGKATASTRKVSASNGRALPAYPAWCCSATGPLGLTVSGQATVRAGGSAAGASAIARAIADATTQARAAARAAGISLGRVVNMQVSAPSYPYPLPMAAGQAGRSTGAPGVSGTTPGPSAVACPVRPQDPSYACASTYASVTITWAIA
jgi:hypothetical protein